MLNFLGFAGINYDNENIASLWANFPVILLQQIYGYLSYVDLVSFLSTCKGCQNTCNEKMWRIMYLKYSRYHVPSCVPSSWKSAFKRLMQWHVPVYDPVILTNIPTSIRVMLISGLAVGKSSLVLRWTNNFFEEGYYDPTIVDIYRKTIQIHNIPFQLNITDVGSDVDFISPTREETDILIAVYDAQSSDTFDLLVKSRLKIPVGVCLRLEGYCQLLYY
eukprot:TRINITY_DN2145_c0_g1_i2.p1 TRINITY_DN2145_c0_g1~~TRINITY_DN2145_c0_g1_i2.p1  ORF type:complete len:219 (-),score=17.62 TRINITY_DN2145_c0_g1_i2:140-796(-)